MATEAWVSEPQILSTTVSSNVSRAVSARRTMGIFHTNCPLGALFNKGCSIQFVHQSSGNGCCSVQDDVCLLEITFDDLYLAASHVLCSMLHQEPVHVLPQRIIIKVCMEEAHPKNNCLGARHLAVTLPQRNRNHCRRWLGGITLGQCLLKLWASCSTTTRRKLNNELRKNLRWFLDHIAT